MLTGMTRQAQSCVLLADRHHQLIEGVRDMLESSFDSLFIVASEFSLTEGVEHLQPAVVIVDLSLIPGRVSEVIDRVRANSPGTKTLLLCSHDEATVARYAREALADGVVLKRAIATDLLPAIDAVSANRFFVSPEIGRASSPDASDTG